MYPWEAGEPWPGSAHPHRLWLDIWSRSRWNVRRVMTGMVIGRLWLTPDLEVLKGHSSLNRLWADVLSNHGKVSEPDKNTGKVLSHMSVSEQIFKTGLYSWKQPPVWAPLHPPIRTDWRLHGNCVMAKQICAKLKPYFRNDNTIVCIVCVFTSCDKSLCSKFEHF